MKTTIIFATEAQSGEIKHASVIADHSKHMGLTIENRIGERMGLSYNALDALIIALQQVQSQIKTGLIC